LSPKASKRAKPKKRPPSKAATGSKAKPGRSALDRVPAGAFVQEPVTKAAQTLAWANRIETIAGGYEAWAQLRRDHSSALLGLSQERRQLDQQGEFLVGAVRAARDLTQTPSIQEAIALATTSAGLDSFVVETAARLQVAKSRVDDRLQSIAQSFDQALLEIRDELRGRIRRTLLHARPHLKLMIRPIGAERRILHFARVAPDHAVLLAWVLLGKLPSRYDFLFDDSTDDASLAPPTLFAEEGVASGQIRPTVAELHALIAASTEVLPIKGALPFFLPRREGPPQLGRLVERGPVMEAELVDGDAFRNLLSRDEAEQIAGYFLRLKLSKQIELELSTD
jgi:hypothetical protein